MHRRLLTLAHDSRLALTLTILTGLLAGFLTIWQAWLLSSTVNTVFLQSNTFAQVWPWLQLILVIIATRAALAWINEISANAVAVRVKNDLRDRLFAHILNLGPAFSRGQRTGELTTAAVEGIEALDAYFSQYLPQLVITALVPISILCFVFPLDLLSGFIFLITAPLIPFFMIMIGKGAEAITKKQYETLSRLSAHFLDSLQGLTTLKLFGQSKSHTKNIARVSDQFRDTTLGVLRVTFLSALALELLATLSTAIIAVEIGLRLLYFKMEFQQAFFLLILAPEFYLPLRMLGTRFHAGMAGTTAARRIFEILDIPVPVNQSSVISEQLSANSNLQFTDYEIRITDVAFTYPNETTPALENINLTIQRGQHIALVGETGAGKSTLVNLLLGFIQPTSGKIITQQSGLDTPDKHGLLDYQLRITGYELRNNIAWVPQRPHLFHDTIAANIRLGKPDASDEEVIAAAQAAHLHEFIQALPQGYDSIIGEGGARLSGGEAQRLAIARAFLKDAPILILDESTSSLDPETESLLEDSTRRLMQGRTVITIAHRLNTIFQADQIIVLAAGKIVETGTHNELLEQNSIYAAMVNVRENNNIIAHQTESHQPVEHQSAQPTLDSPLSSFITPPSPSHSQPPIINRLLYFLNGSWKWVALSVLLGALTIGANVALMGSSAWLIAAAALHPSIAELEVAIVGVRFFGITRAVFRYLERLVSHNVTFRLLARLRVWFYEKLEPLAPARLMEYRAGDLLSRVIADVNMLENLYVRVIAPPLTAIIVAFFTSLFLASFDARLGYSLFGFMLGLGLLLPLLAQRLGRVPGTDLVTRRAELHARLVDGIQGLPDILAFGRAADQQHAIDNSSRAVGHAQRRLALVTGINSGMSVLLTNMGMWTILAFAIPLVSAGKIEGVMLGALSLITLASFEAVMPLPLAAQMWESTRASAKRLFEIVDAEPAVSDRLSVNSDQPHIANCDLRITNLSFAYPSQTTPALQHVTFHLQPGHSLAIVGPSGAGKSTLVNLLLRFWEYSQGGIELGGYSLHSYTQDQVREKIAVVSQNSYFFDASILQNLKLARSSATRPEVEEAMRKAQIHELIASMPKGCDTLIGEQGLRLSGGERQRLAIARALLKDAPILILDEPTANLDPLTEQQVLNTLFETMQGKITLLITHRLIGLEHFNEILVMNHGRVVERGSHTDLFARDTLYRRLWDLQNRILTAAGSTQSLLGSQR